MGMLSVLQKREQIRFIRNLLPILKETEKLELWALSLKDAQFASETQLLRQELASGASLAKIEPRAFALAREASRRRLGERPFDVQLVGGLILAEGSIMEMKTGEGKTLSEVAAAYVHALSGKGVHILTVNDYLAARDCEWMTPVFDLLGISVGLIQPQMETQERRENYLKDVTYGTSTEFGFDYLRDNMVLSLEEKVQRGHHYTIIDEVDSVLIDEARTPLIISGPALDAGIPYLKLASLVPIFDEVKKDPATGEYPQDDPLSMKPAKLDGDYKMEEKNGQISFTDDGLKKLDSLLQKNKIISESLFDGQNFAYVHHMTQAMKAEKLFIRDKQYLVKDGKVQIVDENTGRVLEGRRYSEGLHEAIEAKEHLQVAKQNQTIASITLQNYFRLYKVRSGMTGTALTEAKEFKKIYNMKVIAVPTHRPLARIDNHDKVFINESGKLRAIVKEVKARNKKGQPILIGTTTVEKSEHLSTLLSRAGVKHEVLNAKNHLREANIISQAGACGSVTISTNMAGRGTDIKLGGHNPDVPALERTARGDKVKELGGLFVLGTERHESRRIDNQLRGRSGRQGDPGETQFFVSMGDDLMRLFGGPRVRAMISGIEKRMSEEELETPFQMSFLDRNLERAQIRVEERNYEIRKHLLDFDDVLDTQRSNLYSQRDKILASSPVLPQIESYAHQSIEILVTEYIKQSASHPEAAFTEFNEKLRRNFGIDINAIKEVSPEFNLQLGDTKMEKVIFGILAARLNEQKAVRAQIPNSLPFEKTAEIYNLLELDKAWQSHLLELDSLRESVYLRSFAQRDPIMEYKNESFELFDNALDQVSVALMRALYMGAMPVFQDTEQLEAPEQSMRLEHDKTIDVFEGQEAALNQMPASQQRQRETVTVERATPKVGRNDPCPCGSGKKYKNCHGRFSS